MSQIELGFKSCHFCCGTGSNLYTGENCEECKGTGFTLIGRNIDPDISVTDYCNALMEVRSKCYEHRNH